MNRIDSQREEMVAQVAERGVCDPRVLEALRQIPRHHFVAAQNQSSAYGDFPLPIGDGQTISQPLMVALMTQLLGLTGTETVLEVGTGSGYQTAVLSLLARKVVTIERHPALSRAARVRLSALGCCHIKCVVGDGTIGHAPDAPYDRILVTAGAPQIVPPPLIGQLAFGGRIVIPLGSPRVQELTTLERDDAGHLTQQMHGSCLFVPLIGKYGWDSQALKN